jgi:hypothetical protein
MQGRVWKTEKEARRNLVSLCATWRCLLRDWLEHPSDEEALCLLMGQQQELGAGPWQQELGAGPWQREEVAEEGRLVLEFVGEEGQGLQQ